MKRIYGLDYFVKKYLKVENINLDDETKLSESLEIDKDGSYKKLKIPKKGGTRDICAINAESKLYKIQRNLYKNFLAKIPLSIAAVGFVQGNSYNDFLSAHINKNYYMRLDIKDFFGSISEDHIRDNLSQFVQDTEIIDSIIDICMFENKVPQGAVTSPAISNIIFRKIDQRIIKYCQSITKVCISKKNYPEDITYTRYADDMLFSSNEFDFKLKNNNYFYKMIKNILIDNGFNLNYSKMYISSDYISLSGYVVNKDVHISRKRMKNINTILYYFDKRNKYDYNKFSIDMNKIMDAKLINNLNELKLETWNGDEIKFKSKPQFVNYLCGYRSFLISFLKQNIEKTKGINIIIRKIKKIENLIDKLSEPKTQKN